MRWVVTTRVGPDDGYATDIGPDVPRLPIAFERAGDVGLVQQRVFETIRTAIGRTPPPVTQDLLTIAMSVFAADLRIPRSLASDAWARELALHVPVFDLALWTRLSPRLSRMLEFLTGDSWAFEFRARPETEDDPGSLKPAAVAIADVALFSGGLDSLAGAIELLESGRSVILAGHYGAGGTNSVQQQVLSALQAQHGERVLPCMFHVQPLKAEGNRGEPTMRSRSLLFLSLGTAIATTIGTDRHLTVCENGFISLNVPLTNTRLGTCSTRTTHPHFIALYRELLTELGLAVQIILPARFETKGELLARVSNQGLLRTIAPLSMSCSHPELGRYRKMTPGNHCGYCVPCIVRRASIAAASLPDAAYDLDILAEAVSLSVERKRDLRAFEIAIVRRRAASAASALFDVLASGPLPPAEAARYAGVYRRGLDEVARLLTQAA